MSEQDINPQAQVTVAPVTSPVKYGGKAHGIGKEFDAIYQDVKSHIEEGIVELKKIGAEIKDVLDDTNPKMIEWLKSHEVDVPANANKAKLQELIKAKRAELAKDAAGDGDGAGDVEGGDGGDGAGAGSGDGQDAK